MRSEAIPSKKSKGRIIDCIKRSKSGSLNNLLSAVLGDACFISFGCTQSLAAFFSIQSGTCSVCFFTPRCHWQLHVCISHSGLDVCSHYMLQYKSKQGKCHQYPLANTIFNKTTVVEKTPENELHGHVFEIAMLCKINSKTLQTSKIKFPLLLFVCEIFFWHNWP